MSVKWIGIALLGLFCVVPANAQTAAFDPISCPRAPAGVTWSIFRTPDMVFCRAMSETGEELFALTISRSSPFRPERVNRAEEGTIMGTRFIWYRSAGGPNDLRREALFRVAEDWVMHVTMRATDGEALNRNQKLFETLPVQVHED